MSQPFEVTEGGVFISEGAVGSQILVSPSKFGIGLSAQEKADLLERRLSWLEQALELDPICGR